MDSSRVEISAEVDGACGIDVEPAPLECVGPGQRVERSGHIERLAGIFVEIQIAGRTHVEAAKTERRALSDLHVVTGQPERSRRVDDEVEGEPIPWVERGEGVHLSRRRRRGLCRVRLEQRPLQYLVDLELARSNRHVAGHARRVEVAPEPELGCPASTSIVPMSSCSTSNRLATASI